jgi:hypothetical protein
MGGKGSGRPLGCLGKRPAKTRDNEYFRIMHARRADKMTEGEKTLTKEKRRKAQWMRRAFKATLLLKKQNADLKRKNAQLSASGTLTPERNRFLTPLVETERFSGSLLKNGIYPLFSALREEHKGSGKYSCTFAKESAGILSDLMRAFNGGVLYEQISTEVRQDFRERILSATEIIP